MRAIPFTSLAAAALISLTAFSANAVVFPADDGRFGPGTLTVDTRTGLTWLDLPVTLDLSYPQAEAATQPGGFLAGFRHATTVEVASLFASWGLSEGFCPESSPLSPNVAALVALVGATSGPSALGVTSTRDNSGAFRLAMMNYVWETDTFGFEVTATIPSTSWGLDTHDPAVGHWMVVVPEPSSCALFLAAAVFMLLRRSIEG